MFATTLADPKLSDVSTTALLPSMASAWQELQMRSPDATVFSTWQWNYVTARHFAARSPLRVLLYEIDRPIALLPLMHRRAQTLRALVFLGSGGLNYAPADYQDWLCAQGYEDLALKAFADDLAAESDWDMLWLQELPQTSRLARRLPQLARQRGWRVIVKEHDDAYHIDLPPTWDEYAERLSSNWRANMGRKTRKLIRESDGRFEHVEAGNLLPALETLFELHQKRWTSIGKPGIFARKEMRSFHQDLAQTLQRDDMLDLVLLHAGDETIGARYSFNFRGVHSFYASGFDPDERWASHSLGMLMDVHGISNAIKQGMSREDLLRGDGDYKQRYAPTHTVNLDLRVFRTAGAYHRYRLYQTLRRVARRLLRRKDAR